jgi:hypothetical protein
MTLDAWIALAVVALVVVGKQGHSGLTMGSAGAEGYR